MVVQVEDGRLAKLWKSKGLDAEDPEFIAAVAAFKQVTGD